MIKVKILLLDGTEKEFYAADFAQQMSDGKVLYWMLDENESRAFSIPVKQIKWFSEDQDEEK